MIALISTAYKKKTEMSEPLTVNLFIIIFVYYGQPASYTKTL